MTELSLQYCIASPCSVSGRVLGDIALEAASQKREPVAIKALSIVGSLALEFAGKGLDAAARNAAESLGTCGKGSSRMKMETMISLSEVYLMPATENFFISSLHRLLRKLKTTYPLQRYITIDLQELSNDP